MPVWLSAPEPGNPYFHGLLQGEFTAVAAPVKPASAEFLVRATVSNFAANQCAAVVKMQFIPW
jgi:hypothetical protein